MLQKIMTDGRQLAPSIPHISFGLKIASPRLLAIPDVEICCVKKYLTGDPISVLCDSTYFMGRRDAFEFEIRGA